jgi:hypothetical protein
MDVGAQMIDGTVLRGAMRCIESAAMLAVVGQHGEAVHRVGLAIELLQGCVRDDYDAACSDGTVELERLFNSERDVRPSDDGETR